MARDDARADEMAAILAANPYRDTRPEHTYVMFLDEAPAPGALQGVASPDGEQLALGAREIYVHYPNGMGRSKLKVPYASVGTARNLKTVSKLIDLSRGS